MMLYDGEHCPNCQAVEYKAVPLTKGVHHAKRVCAFCGTFLKFEPKPENEKRRAGASLNLALKFGIEYCEMCLRHKSELPKGQTLHGHHVIEHQDGGGDERGNVWVVCTHCHELVGLIRRRLGRNHLRKDGAA